MAPDLGMGGGDQADAANQAAQVQAQAAKYAADLQYKSAQESNALMKEFYYTGRSDLAPWRYTGQMALDLYSGLLGMPSIYNTQMPTLPGQTTQTGTGVGTGGAAGTTFTGTPGGSSPNLGNTLFGGVPQGQPLATGGGGFITKPTSLNWGDNINRTAPPGTYPSQYFQDYLKQNFEGVPMGEIPPGAMTQYQNWPAYTSGVQYAGIYDPAYQGYLDEIEGLPYMQGDRAGNYQYKSPTGADVYNVGGQLYTYGPNGYQPFTGTGNIWGSPAQEGGAWTPYQYTPGSGGAGGGGGTGGGGAGTNALNPYDISSPSNRINAEEWVKRSPGYQFQFGEGLDALDRSAASRGMLLSGAQSRAAQEYGQNFGMGYYNTLMDRLGALSGIGQTSSAQTGQYGMNAANQMAQTNMQAATNMGAAKMAGAQAIGSGYINAANAQQANTNALIQSAPGLLTAGYQIGQWLAPFIFSDIRTKSDIRELRPVSFLYRPEFGGGRHLGFVADEVEKIAPQAVVTAPNGMKALEPMALITLLIQAVQDLHTRIDKLSAKMPLL